MKNAPQNITEQERIDHQPDGLDTIPEPVHPTKSTKYANRLVAASLIVIAIGLGVFLKWSFQPENVLVVKNSPFPTRSVRTNAEPNGVIILTVDFCKNTDKKGEVRTSFVSQSREVFLPLSHENLDKGCAKEELPILIPKDLPADNYKLKFIVRYNLNPLKEVVPVTFESQTFHVNPGGTDAQLSSPEEK